MAVLGVSINPIEKGGIRTNPLGINYSREKGVF